MICYKPKRIPKPIPKQIPAYIPWVCIVQSAVQPEVGAEYVFPHSQIKLSLEKPRGEEEGGRIIGEEPIKECHRKIPHIHDWKY